MHRGSREKQTSADEAQIEEANNTGEYDNESQSDQEDGPEEIPIDQHASGGIRNAERQTSHSTTDSEEELDEDNSLYDHSGESERKGDQRDGTQPLSWSLEEANSNPFHFKKFLTASAKEKFDGIFTGKNSRGLQTHGKNMKQVYQVTLSSVELDKFEA